jgi:hypothetical protein
MRSLGSAPAAGLFQASQINRLIAVPVGRRSCLTVTMRYGAQRDSESYGH